MLEKEQSAPNFELLDANQNAISLHDFLGKKVVLYFYPKDDTPGCTKEAIGFSELLSEFSDNNTVVIGVSKDSPESHLKFIQKYDLKVYLLSDPTGGVLESYGVWQEKSNYGKNTWVCSVVPFSLMKKA